MPAGISEAEETARGEELATALHLRKMGDGRYLTAWGTKTTLGLYRTVKRIIDGSGSPQQKENQA